MKNILIGGAWPYANGSLHIGHIAGLLPGDVLARYYRAKGNSVYYVSGSDCHGTPVTIRAREEGRSPRAVSDGYHREFCEVFHKLGFSYDLYGKTSDSWHIDFVRDFHRQLYGSGYVSERTVPQAFCPACGKTLTDRLVTGICPRCGVRTRGDQCDGCGAVLEAEQLEDARCSVCGGSLTFPTSRQLYIELSRLEKELTAYREAHPWWRKNAAAFTSRYLDEGLRDRAITRDLDWGIPVPREGYEDKRIYIWAENILGYLSASKVVADRRGADFAQVWGDNARHYYVHGKDNIPFHTIILPALLLAHGGGWRLPDDIISSEHLTLEGRKISTSQNWAIWAKDIVDRYDPDALRYFFIANGPEKRDTDFSWREFVERSNSELLGAYGNFVNRTLAFLTKYAQSTVPVGALEVSVGNAISAVYGSAGQAIEDGRLKDALEGIFELVRWSNRYFDGNEPWRTRTANPESCRRTLFNCVQLAANLSILLAPFLPFSSGKVFSWLGLRTDWHPQFVPADYVLPPISVLFTRLDTSVVNRELDSLRDPIITTVPDRVLTAV